MNSSVGSNIKRIVKEKGHNVEWLARELGVTKQSLYKTLSKDSFHTDTISKIANVLNVPIIELYKDVKGFSSVSGSELGDKGYILLTLVDSLLSNFFGKIESNPQLTHEQIVVMQKDFLNTYKAVLNKIQLQLHIMADEGPTNR